MKKDVKANVLEGRVIVYSITQVQDWNHLSEELHYVRQQCKVYHENIRTSQPLPIAYTAALDCLHVLVVSSLIDKACHLGEPTYVSPAWRSMWQVNAQSSGFKQALVK